MFLSFLVCRPSFPSHLVSDYLLITAGNCSVDCIRCLSGVSASSWGSGNKVTGQGPGPRFFPGCFCFLRRMVQIQEQSTIRRFLSSRCLYISIICKCTLQNCKIYCELTTMRHTSNFAKSTERIYAVISRIAHPYVTTVCIWLRLAPPIRPTPLTGFLPPLSLRVYP